MMRDKISEVAKLGAPLFSAILILLASMFIAILFKETIWQQEWSKRLPIVYWLLLPLAATLGMLVLWIIAKGTNLWTFYGFTLAVLITIAMDSILNSSPLPQLFWFTALSLILGMFTFLLPGLVLQGRSISIRERMKRLRENISLTKIWTNYSIQARYSQSLLGVGWVMLYPLLEAAVMGFAFSVLMRRGDVAGKPFIIFLLSGIVMFNLFSRTVNKSTISLIGAMGVIQQIYFPREIILIVLIGEELVNFLFTALTLILVNAVLGTYPDIHYLILFLPMLIMAAIAFGTSFFTSFSNLVFRDLQQLIMLVTRLLFFVTVLFSLRIASPSTDIYVLLNPLTALVEFFRSIVLYEQPPQLAILIWPATLAIALLYSGYIFFAHNEGRFIDFS